MVTPGYAGGSVEQPTYKQVSSGLSGHAEVIRIEFDPKTISFRDLLTVFFATHDPTTPNRQGGDVGEQYRSVIYFSNDAQRAEAERFIANLEAERVWERPIVTQILPLEKFYEAEDYHRRYFERNTQKPYCQFIISPKLAKLRKQFAPLLKPMAAKM